MARILIADDDEIYREAFETAMTAFGHEVTEVAEGDAVIPEMHRRPFDVVFLDLMMAGGGAISALHAVRRLHSDVPVVIITGRTELASSPLMSQGLRAADAKVLKTATPTELDRLVASLTG